MGRKFSVVAITVMAILMLAVVGGAMADALNPPGAGVYLYIGGKHYAPVNYRSMYDTRDKQNNFKPKFFITNNSNVQIVFCGNVASEKDLLSVNLYRFDKKPNYVYKRTQLFTSVAAITFGSYPNPGGGNRSEISDQQKLDFRHKKREDTVAVVPPPLSPGLYCIETIHGPHENDYNRAVFFQIINSKTMK